MAAVIQALYIVSLVFLGVFSYGYTDPHLRISGWLAERLFHLAYYERPLATMLFASLLLVLFACYLYFLKHPPKVVIIGLSALILVFSYPALTYDLFNYMTTAKVLFTHRENPYIVMPIEIPGEENLSFTRAANKVALYGPIWLLFTFIPHTAGMDNIWQTMIVFKATNALVYLLFAYMIYRLTKNYTNVIFFALNPLVLIEVLGNGHNDIYMMILALLGLRYRNIFLMVASWLIKGATVVLAPLLVLRLTWERMLVVSYWLLAAVFFIVAPMREELYPWYAVWLIAPAALLPVKKYQTLWIFTVVLSFALELRALPYMWMGYYEGPGPALRTLLTLVPILGFSIWYVWKRKRLLF